MVDFGPGLRAFLLGDAMIAGMVGNRIWTHPLPQASPVPAITYLQAGGAPVPVHTTGVAGHRGPRVQIDCWAKVRDEAVALDLAVLNRLAAFRGDMGAIAVQGIFPDEARDFYESDAIHARLARDYIIWLVG